MDGLLFALTWYGWITTVLAVAFAVFLYVKFWMSVGWLLGFNDRPYDGEAEGDFMQRERLP